VDTAGTLCNAATALMERGATGVSAYVTHGVLSPPALERIQNSVMDELVMTDSILNPDVSKKCPKIRIASVAGLLAEAVRRINDESSVSSLFD
jgi:ribose-phosphate pyrophosphokinase